MRYSKYYRDIRERTGLELGRLVLLGAHIYIAFVNFISRFFLFLEPSFAISYTSRVNTLPDLLVGELLGLHKEVARTKKAI